MQKTMVYLCTRITDTVKNVMVNIHDMPYFVTACILSHNLKFSCWFVCFFKPNPLNSNETSFFPHNFQCKQSLRGLKVEIQLMFFQ